MHQSDNGVVILGAGLAGLSAAFHQTEPYEIFEKEQEAGGVARSFEIDGFTFDHAVHILYTKDPYAGGLIQKLLGENFTRQARSSWVYSHDTYTLYPYQANTCGLPDQVIKQNILGVIQAAYSGTSRPVENFEDWIYATFGKGIAENFMIPFNRKVWAIDPKRMGFQWIASRVPMPALEEILTGAFTEQKKGFGPNAEFWYPRVGGTGALPNSFLPHVKNLHLCKTATGIYPDKHEVVFHDSTSARYVSLITSLPLPRLVSLINGVPQAVRSATDQLLANKVITVNLGVDRANISDMHWIYFPEEKYVFQRISLPMNFASSLVPPGTSSILVEISTSPFRPVEMKGLLELTITGLVDAGILRPDDRFRVQKIMEIDPAYVIYDNHHREAVDTIHSYLHKQRIFPCGRFGDWEYLNMDQAILSGKRASEESVS